MQTRKYVIASPRGLHPQACARIVEIAKHCRCTLSLVGKGRRVNARNLVAVMLLTATMGATVMFEADGPEERLAIRQISVLLDDGLGERR